VKMRGPSATFAPATYIDQPAPTRTSRTDLRALTVRRRAPRPPRRSPRCRRLRTRCRQSPTHLADFAYLRSESCCRTAPSRSTSHRQCVWTLEVFADQPAIRAACRPPAEVVAVGGAPAAAASTGRECGSSPRSGIHAHATQPNGRGQAGELAPRRAPAPARSRSRRLRHRR
jgi:hypothetical protein